MWDHKVDCNDVYHKEGKKKERVESVRIHKEEKMHRVIYSSWRESYILWNFKERWDSNRHGWAERVGERKALQMTSTACQNQESVGRAQGQVNI